MADAGVLAGRLAIVVERIALASARSGRDPASVRLLPIAKGFGPGVVAEAMRLGLKEFGENRVQEAEAKIAATDPRPRWHLVGHLQRNKAKRAVQLFDVIQSLDSAGLVDEVSGRAVQMGRTIRCLVEVNTSGEKAKFGAEVSNALRLIEHARDSAGIELEGLMTIGPLEGGPQGARTSFRALRELREQAARAGLLAEDAELSMGMSDDFEIAVEEGATMVRIGTGLFGPRPARA